MGDNLDNQLDAVTSGQPEDTSMPPIVRPEDINIGGKAEAQTESSPAVSVPSFSDQISPREENAEFDIGTNQIYQAQTNNSEALGQVASTYHAEPTDMFMSESAVSANETSAQVSEPAPEISPQTFEPPERTYSPMPQVAATPNPAMVPDPLYPESPQPAPRVAVDGSTIKNPVVSGVSGPGEPTRKKASQPIFSYLKYVFAAAIVLVLGVGGYYGYISYGKNQRAQLLSDALKNISNLEQSEYKFEFTGNGQSGNFVLDVDSSKNAKLEASGDTGTFGLLYLKTKDSAFLRNGDTSVRKFAQYSNISGFWDFIFSDLEGLKGIITNPASNNEIANNIRFEGQEDIDGVKCEKYRLVLNADSLRSISKIITGEEDKLIQDEEVLSLSFIVSPKSRRVISLGGTAKTMAMQNNTRLENIDEEEGLTQNLPVLTSYSFSLTANYGYEGSLKLPIGSKITSKESLLTIAKDLFGSE